MVIQIGGKLPNVVLYEGTPNNIVNVTEIFSKDKKGILFGVPGAFTPVCSNQHLPSYVKDYEALKAKGVSEIVCVSVNDPFVMDAWGKHHKADGKVRMLADPSAEFTKALGLDIDLTSKLGNVRSKRYAMIVEGGVVKHLSVEAETSAAACTLANDITKQL